MTRALPRSELQLTRAQVRDLVACPLCSAPKGARCYLTLKSGHGRLRVATSHQERWQAARDHLRARRLGAQPTDPNGTGGGEDIDDAGSSEDAQPDPGEGGPNVSHTPESL